MSDKFDEAMENLKTLRSHMPPLLLSEVRYFDTIQAALIAGQKAERALEIATEYVGWQCTRTSNFVCFYGNHGDCLYSADPNRKCHKITLIEKPEKALTQPTGEKT